MIGMSSVLWLANNNAALGCLVGICHWFIWVDRIRFVCGGIRNVQLITWCMLLESEEYNDYETDFGVFVHVEEWSLKRGSSEWSKQRASSSCFSSFGNNCFLVAKEPLKKLFEPGHLVSFHHFECSSALFCLSYPSSISYFHSRILYLSRSLKNPNLFEISVQYMWSYISVCNFSWIDSSVQTDSV